MQQGKTPKKNEELSSNKTAASINEWPSIIGGAISYTITRFAFYGGESPGFLIGILSFMIGFAIVNCFSYLVQSTYQSDSDSD